MTNPINANANANINGPIFPLNGAKGIALQVNASVRANPAIRTPSASETDEVEARANDKFAIAHETDGLELAGDFAKTVVDLENANLEVQAKLQAFTADAPELQASTKVQAMHADVDPWGMYEQFVTNNPAQSMLDRLLRGDFPPEFLEGPAGQIHLMMIQDAMQARTNFMNMLSNIMKKNDEAASTVIGNMR